MYLCPLDADAQVVLVGLVELSLQLLPVFDLELKNHVKNDNPS